MTPVFAFIVFAFCNAKYAQKPVYYQVHSWNDMNLWENGFKQNMEKMKIDAHYIESQSFCNDQSQVTSNTQNGCFLLSHDMPTELRQYNTTDNVLQYISNNIIQFNSSISPILLAVCFKLSNALPCGTSETAIKWRILVTNLMNNFTNIISKYNLTLQIILDGNAADVNTSENECQINAWEPYMKTFVGKPSNPIALSNDNTLGYNRFSILDTSVSDTSTECVNSFENWVKVGFEKYNFTQQPWLWWEPSSQECIRELTNSYNNSEFIHDPGFYFAINIDIPRFKVYSNYNAWNEPMMLNSQYNSDNSSQVLSGWINPIKQNETVIISFKSSDILLYSITTASYAASNDIQISQWMPVNSELNGELTAMNGLIFDNKYYFVISNQYGFISLFYTILTEYSITKTLEQSLLPNICQTNISANSIYFSQNENTNNFTIYQIFVCGNIFGIQLWNSDIITNWVPINDPILIPFEDINTISDVSIAASGTNIISVWSSTNKIYGILLENNIAFNSYTQISVGNSPRISINNNDLILVNDNGYCWISESHLKSSRPATCDATPISIKGVLSYSLASFDDWIKRFKAKSPGIISVCDRYVIHGMFDAGFKPYSSILSDKFNNKAIITIQQSIKSQEYINSELNGCGPSITRDDIILDSWIV